MGSAEQGGVSGQCPTSAASSGRGAGGDHRRESRVTAGDEAPHPDCDRRASLLPRRVLAGDAGEEHGLSEDVPVVVGNLPVAVEDATTVPVVDYFRVEVGSDATDEGTELIVASGSLAGAASPDDRGLCRREWSAQTVGCRRQVTAVDQLRDRKRNSPPDVGLRGGCKVGEPPPVADRVEVGRYVVAGDPVLLSRRGGGAEHVRAERSGTARCEVAEQAVRGLCSGTYAVPREPFSLTRCGDKWWEHVAGVRRCWKIEDVRGLNEQGCEGSSVGWRFGPGPIATVVAATSGPALCAGVEVLA